MRQSKSWFTWVKKRPQKEVKENEPVTQRRGQKKHYTKNYFSRYLSYVKAYLKQPFPEFAHPQANNSFHGLTTILLISLFNTISLTAVANYFVSRYDWFANISILPNVSFTFTPWLFAIKTFFFLVISLWLLPFVIHCFKKIIYKEETDSAIWLSEFMGMNVFSLTLSFIGLLMALLAPLLFFVVILFLLIIQLVILNMAAVVSFTPYSNQRVIPLFYIILGAFFTNVLIEFILFSLIF